MMVQHRFVIPTVISHALITTSFFFLAGCSGGGSGSSGGNGGTQTPSASVTSVTVSCTASSLLTSQTSQCSATVLGAGSFSSAVTWSATGGTVTSGGLFTATSVGTAAVTATSNQDSTKSGHGNIAVTPLVSGSLVITAAPTDTGSGSSPWQLVVAATDSAGNPISGLTVNMSTTGGVFGTSVGTTDSTGIFNSSIAPPTSYAGQAVAVVASAGGQTAAVNIVFAPSSFNPAAVTSGHATLTGTRATTSPTSHSAPFVIGVNGLIGTTNPFLSPTNTCYSNIDLNSALSAKCRTTFSSGNLVQTVLAGANIVCSAADTVGVLSCAGVAVNLVSCALVATGVGAAICFGTISYVGVLQPICEAYIAGQIAKYLAPKGSSNLDIAASGIQTDPLSLNDDIGFVCAAAKDATIGQGTGSSGTSVTISPPQTTAILGQTVQLSTVTTAGNGGAVVYSVNGVPLGGGTFGTVTANGLYTAPMSLPVPSQITVAATTVADPTAHAPALIRILPTPPGTITTVVGNGQAGYSGDGGSATSAKLSGPSGVAFDGGSNMFIADSTNNVIRRVDASTGLISTIAGSALGAAGFAGDTGPGTAALLKGPSHVAFDRTVNLYITDANNNRIRKVDSISATILTVAGNGTAAFLGDGGPATSAELNFPDGIALDSNGNYFIGDAGNNRVREVTLATGVISTVAGNGVPGLAGDGGAATNAELKFPSRPFVNSAGDIYIADYQNNCVRKVSATTGIITTVAGNGFSGYSGDGGLATSAQLNGPISVALDAAGNLFIADLNNERIRAVNMGTSAVTLLGVSIQPGRIATVVGNGATGYSGDRNLATAAAINFPTGLLVDSGGNLYFADLQNNVIRKVTGP